MPMSKFLLISYKPSSDDYCRGCHMAAYSSECVMWQFNTIDQVMDAMANFDALPLGPNEDGYDHMVYTKNYEGIVEYYLEKEELEEVDRRTKAKVALARKEEEDRKNQASIEARLKREQQERAELERLQEKYNG
jgi:hypothetical protein